MIKFALWGSATLLLLLSIVDKLAQHTGPSWWTVFLAFSAGCGLLQILHVLHEEADEEAHDET